MLALDLALHASWALHLSCQEVAPVFPFGEKPYRTAVVAVIGDYGQAGSHEEAVAKMVHGWKPDIVLTLGDNNYNFGDAKTMDENVFQYYGRYIDKGRFFPSIGNHDALGGTLQPYFDAFDLPGNERYYEFEWGPIHGFAINSCGDHEPDGVDANSVQAQWLKKRAMASQAPFQIAYFHHPPYSSGILGSNPDLQWPFDEWGIDLVLTGHNHVYERIVRDQTPFIVNGVGGRSLYPFGETIVEGSRERFNLNYGAVLINATRDALTLHFRDSTLHEWDVFALGRRWRELREETLVAQGALWSFHDTGTDPGATWNQPGFDDSAWESGPAELGYGDGDETTPVEFGGDPLNKFATTHFRHEFEVADAGVYQHLRLGLQRDDGAAVYLNGTEVHRTYLAPDATYESFAILGVAGDEELVLREVLIDPALLVNGTNTLAVEVHQAAPTSSDLSFDANLVGVLDGQYLVERGSAWRYRDSGVAPGPKWRDNGYDDSGWPLGVAEFGFGDGDEATPIGFGGNPAAKHLTSWYRHDFTVPAPADVRALFVRLLREDGVALYLNGEPVYRHNLPSGELDGTEEAPLEVEGAAETVWARTSIDPGLLRPGVNTLAAEVHLSSPESLDTSFDLELVALGL